MSGEDAIIVRPSPIRGTVRLSGAKNSALKVLAASILTDESLHVSNFPGGLLDVQLMIRMLERLGKKVRVAGDQVDIGGECRSFEVGGGERSVRTTLLMLATLTGRYGKGAVPLPGGCRIGVRKYDLHQLVLESLGARFWAEGDYLHTSAPDGLKGADITLPLRSTGATESALLAGVLARGTTTLWNPHVRPEVLDLIRMLRAMGATIRVYGQERLEIFGVESLRGATHEIIPDNIEAFTFVIGAAVSGGDVEIRNFPLEHLEVPLVFARASGVRVFVGDRSVIVRGGKTFPVEISTGPYPGINSDLQPLFAVLALLSPGESRITDLRFPERFGYAEELRRLGGDLGVNGNILTIRGGRTLTGTRVRALDLRCGAALLVAGLMAQGQTVILDPQQIDRGYEDIVGKMSKLGASITRTTGVDATEPTARKS